MKNFSSSFPIHVNGLPFPVISGKITSTLRSQQLSSFTAVSSQQYQHYQLASSTACSKQIASLHKRRVSQIHHWAMSVGRKISNRGRSLAISNFFGGPYFATQRAFLSSDLSSGDSKLSIPMEKLDFAYSRSSGPGTDSSPESTQNYISSHFFFI